MIAKKRILTACLCMFAVSVCAPPAGAELIIIGITGEVDKALDWDGFLGGAVQEGDVITGTYTYDTSTPDSEAFPLKGTYLYDSIRNEVSDVPKALFMEIGSLKKVWDGSQPPLDLPDLKDEHRNAINALKDRINKEKMAKDRKVRETQMSTIYREIKFHFDPNSLKLISSKRVMLPFWTRKEQDGKLKWEVNAFLGSISKPM